MINSCPFSKKAYESDKVLEVVGGRKDMHKYIDDWDDTYQVIVFKPKFTFLGWYSYCINMEKWFSKTDIIAIPNGKEKYILIQRLEELVDASNYLLVHSDYYSKYTPSQMKHVERRRSLLI